MGEVAAIVGALLEKAGEDRLEEWTTQSFVEHPGLIPIVLLFLGVGLLLLNIVWLRAFLNPRSRPEALKSLRVKTRTLGGNVASSVREALSWRAFRQGVAAHRVELIALGIVLSAMSAAIYMRNGTLFMIAVFAGVVFPIALNVHRERAKSSRVTETNAGPNAGK